MSIAFFLRRCTAVCEHGQPLSTTAASLLGKPCKAVIQVNFGSVDVLKVVSDRIVPETLKKGEVLIQQYGSSVNPAETKRRQGYGRVILPWVMGTSSKFPMFPGNDIAGVVVKAGPESKFKEGDRVWGFNIKGGAWAEICKAEEKHLSYAPKSVPLHKSGTIPYVAITFGSCLRTADLKASNMPGKRVFINGGSGGVGTFGIQLLRAFGASEIAVTCSGRNAELCHELGATTVIDYTKEDYTEKLEDFDLYIDCINNTDEMRRKGMKILKPGGYYVTIVFPLMYNTDDFGMVRGLWKTGRWLLSNRNYAKKTHGVTFNMNIAQMPKMGSPYLQEVADIVDQGKLRPVIYKDYTLDEIKAAHEQIQTGRTAGKVCVVVKEEL